MSETVTPCPVTFEPKTGQWYVHEDWSFPALGSVVTVKEGTETDLASIPRLFRWLISKANLGIEGAVAHDELYRAGGRPKHCEPPRTYTRKEADDLFLWIMRQRGVNWFKAHAAHQAVRRFGAHAWRDSEPDQLDKAA